MRALFAAILALGCGRSQNPAPGGDAPVDDDGASAELPPYAPAPARLHRLGADALRDSFALLTGVVYTGPLPTDTTIHGYTVVAGSELSVSPLDLEMAEAAAWGVTDAALATLAAAEARFGCALEAPFGSPDLDATACVRAFAAGFGGRAWRRPLGADEVDGLLALHDEVRGATGDALLAAQAVHAAILLSPWSVYRVERGVPHPSVPGRRLLTAHEKAARLAFFLTGRTPDDALLAAAAAGTLDAPEGLEAEARRLLATPAAWDHLTRFFAETLDLPRLDLVSKDPLLFPEFDAGLRAAMRAEVELLFQETVFAEDGDFRSLFTTDRTWVDGRLAPLYGLAIADDAPRATTLPPWEERGGVLGRAAFLTLHAPDTFTSPTRRGKAIRTRILCQAVPPPPEGVVASLDDVQGEGTLRQRLEAHVEDPACAGCHTLMDPLGFPLEGFDAIGVARTHDNGVPVDISGRLDDTDFHGAAALGALVAAHPQFDACTARQLYRFAAGHKEGEGEEVVVSELAEAFADGGHRLQALALAIVLHPAFGEVGAPAGEACSAEGARRPCHTDCGSGEEACIGGEWQGCTAPPPAPEACDAADNDCDGAVDDDIEAPCTAAGGLPGTRLCAGGAWGECAVAAAAPEVCNGVDDDGDGGVDESLGVAVVARSWAEVVAAHDACDPSADPSAPACRAAATRACAAAGCGLGAGIGVVDTDGAGARAALGCVGPAHGVVQSTSFTALSQQHGGCRIDTRTGPDCFAAIHRACAAAGLTSGTGPVENSGDIAITVCTPGAAVYTVGYAELALHVGGCDGSTRWGPACDAAIHRWCKAAGHETGFGPVENWDATAVVSCIGDGA
jgi:hypothetical protein